MRRDAQPRALAEVPPPDDGDPQPVPIEPLQIIAFEEYGIATPSCAFSVDGTLPAPTLPDGGTLPDGDILPINPTIRARMDGDDLVLAVENAGSPAPAVHVTNQPDSFELLNAHVNICVQFDGSDSDCAHVVLNSEDGTKRVPVRPSWDLRGRSFRPSVPATTTRSKPARAITSRLATDRIYCPAWVDWSRWRSCSRARLRMRAAVGGVRQRNRRAGRAGGLRARRGPTALRRRGHGRQCLPIHLRRGGLPDRIPLRPRPICRRPCVGHEGEPQCRPFEMLSTDVSTHAIAQLRLVNVAGDPRPEIFAVEMEAAGAVARLYAYDGSRVIPGANGLPLGGFPLLTRLADGGPFLRAHAPPPAPSHGHGRPDLPGGDHRRSGTRPWFPRGAHPGAADGRPGPLRLASYATPPDLPSGGAARYLLGSRRRAVERRRRPRAPDARAP